VHPGIRDSPLIPNPGIEKTGPGLQSQLRIVYVVHNISDHSKAAVRPNCSLLWTDAQRASVLYFADVFLSFFMRALVGQTVLFANVLDQFIPGPP